MNSISQSVPGSGVFGKIVFTILALVALYYLYQYLFGPNGLEGKQVLNSIIPGNPDTALVTLGKTLPALYEGGEYSVNAWIYINDYAVNRGQNKHILSLGGDGFLTLLVYLGPYKNSLHVRVHTKDPSNGPAPASSSPSELNSSDMLTSDLIKGKFSIIQQDSELLSVSRPCDIPSVDLQKWTQVSVTINNKIVDVYIDGKLARSCILPSFFKVDKSNMKLSLVDYKGFGGFISNTSVYNYALNPEQVWRMYMSGPGAQYTFWEYIKAMFDPSSVNTTSYPKMNITG
jgi:hypothetical protein